jgi:hypothetical protein
MKERLSAKESPAANEERSLGREASKFLPT